MKYLFETERLRLRAFAPEDAGPLFECHLDGEVKRWIPNESYGDVAEAEAAVRFFADRADRKALPLVLAAELKENGLLIGDAGINEVDGRPGEVEIGFVVRREYRGQGYASELSEAMTAFAFSALRAKALFGRVLRGNDASARVLEKSGYRFVAEESGAEDDPYGNGMLVFKREAPPEVRGRSVR